MFLFCSRTYFFVLDHAAWGQGAGYCVFNDLIASYFELKDRGKCAIIDLDVHQGDGTIQIVNRLKMSDFPILDLSAKGNFPFRKQVPLLGKSVLLEDRLQDDAYLEVLERELQLFVRAHGKFDFILYQAGVDVLEGDKLGRLGLTLNGLKRRDAMVYALAKSMGARCLSFCGGGYFEKDDKIGLENVVAAHVQQILEMRNAFE